MKSARFAPGEIVHHRLFDYRGVVVDVDPVFGLQEEWYEQVARSRPPKNEPWYHVVVDGATHTTYVAEQNLESDDTGAPVEHPLLELLFDRFEDGRYYKDEAAN